MITWNANRDYVQLHYHLYKLIKWTTEQKTTLYLLLYRIIKAQWSSFGAGLQHISTMCVLTVKMDENNHPVRAKTIRIVVLGNLEEREWSRPECYAPVLL
jgi:hypothetical protein